MDTLTHALSGALLARATEPRTPNADALPQRTRMWVGFWAAAFPDSDFILRFVDPLTYLTAHRGVTHSVLLLPLWALLLALVFTALYRGRYRWRTFFGVCALSLAAHIVGDVITAFGTMIFAPMSDVRVALPFTFIIDPYFSAILIAGLIGSALWRSRRAAVGALLVLAAYVGAQGWLHQQALRIGETYAAGLNREQAQIHALPQPFSPFHWMVVVEEPEAYHLAFVSLWRRDALQAPADANWLVRIYASFLPADKLRWAHVPRFGASTEHRALARQLWQSEALAEYRHFALFPALYRVDANGARQCVWFNDLRFTMTGRDMPFRYGVCRENEGAAWKVYPFFDGGH